MKCNAFGDILDLGMIITNVSGFYILRHQHSLTAQAQGTWTSNTRTTRTHLHQSPHRTHGALCLKHDVIWDMRLPLCVGEKTFNKIYLIELNSTYRRTELRNARDWLYLCYFALFFYQGICEITASSCCFAETRWPRRRDPASRFQVL